VAAFFVKRRIRRQTSADRKSRGVSVTTLDRQNPLVLEALRGVATHVVTGEGEAQVVDLKVVSIK